jgi:hypothetical protein
MGPRRRGGAAGGVIEHEQLTLDEVCLGCGVTGDDSAAAARRVRAEAAIRLIREGEVSPLLALSYVCWPSAKLEALSSRPSLAEERRRRGLALRDAGMSRQRVALELGVAKGTVQGWEKRRAEEAERQAA